MKGRKDRNLPDDNARVGVDQRGDRLVNNPEIHQC